MLRIALNLRRPPILNGDQHTASIGAVVRTRGMDDLLHRASIIWENYVATAAFSCRLLRITHLAPCAASSSRIRCPKTDNRPTLLLQLQDFLLFSLAHLFHLLDFAVGQLLNFVERALLFVLGNL